MMVVAAAEASDHFDSPLRPTIKLAWMLDVKTKRAPKRFS